MKERDGINIEVRECNFHYDTPVPFSRINYLALLLTKRMQDLSLPRTMVQRLAKGVLPPNTSLHKDAVLAMSKGATVFINYLAQA